MSYSVIDGLVYLPHAFSVVVSGRPVWISWRSLASKN